MSKDLRKDWEYFDTLSRKEVMKLAEDEIMDVRGLSRIKEILLKYNLSSVSFDYKLRIIFKKSTLYTPRKEYEKIRKSE